MKVLRYSFTAVGPASPLGILSTFESVRGGHYYSTYFIYTVRKTEGDWESQHLRLYPSGAPVVQACLSKVSRSMGDGSRGLLPYILHPLAHFESIRIMHNLAQLVDFRYV